MTPILLSSLSKTRLFDKKDWDKLIKGTEFPERGDMGIKAVLKEFFFWTKQITSQAIGRFAGEIKQPLSII